MGSTVQRMQIVDGREAVVRFVLDRTRAFPQGYKTINGGERIPLGVTEWDELVRERVLRAEAMKKARKRMVAFSKAASDLSIQDIEVLVLGAAGALLKSHNQPSKRMGLAALLTVYCRRNKIEFRDVDEMMRAYYTELRGSRTARDRGEAKKAQAAMRKESEGAVEAAKPRKSQPFMPE